MTIAVTQPELDKTDRPNTPVRLRNDSCPYCFAPLDKTNTNVEHVIGRRFVPRGTMQNSWNLIVRTCIKCNSDKAKLENDISAITMYNRGGNDLVLSAEIERKTKSSTRGLGAGVISQKTGRPISQSNESIELTSRMEDATVQGGIGSLTSDRISFQPTVADVAIRAQLTGPPQIDPRRVEALAHFHIKAMIYYINQEAGGVYLAEKGEREVGIMMVNYAPRQDWGNSYQTSFRDLFLAWPRWRLIVHAADGYFKVSIREKAKTPLIAWALEWNKSYRMIGYIGKSALIHEEAGHLVAPRFHQISSTDRYRAEISLAESADTLFSFGD